MNAAYLNAVLLVEWARAAPRPLLEKSCSIFSGPARFRRTSGSPHDEATYYVIRTYQDLAERQSREDDARKGAGRGGIESDV